MDCCLPRSLFSWQSFHALNILSHFTQFHFVLLGGFLLPHLGPYVLPPGALRFPTGHAGGLFIVPEWNGGRSGSPLSLECPHPPLRLLFVCISGPPMHDGTPHHNGLALCMDTSGEWPCYHSAQACLFWRTLSMCELLRTASIHNYIYGSQRVQCCLCHLDWHHTLSTHSFKSSYFMTSLLMLRSSFETHCWLLSDLPQNTSHWRVRFIPGELSGASCMKS